MTRTTVLAGSFRGETRITVSQRTFGADFAQYVHLSWRLLRCGGSAEGELIFNILGLKTTYVTCCKLHQELLLLQKLNLQVLQAHLAYTILTVLLQFLYVLLVLVHDRDEHGHFIFYLPYIDIFSPNPFPMTCGVVATCPLCARRTGGPSVIGVPRLLSSLLSLSPSALRRGLQISRSFRRATLLLLLLLPRRAALRCAAPTPSSWPHTWDARRRAERKERGGDSK